MWLLRAKKLIRCSVCFPAYTMSTKFLLGICICLSIFQLLPVQASDVFTEVVGGTFEGHWTIDTKISKDFEIRVMKKNGKIMTNERLRTTFDPDNQQLAVEIYPVQMEDTGDYTVIVDDINHSGGTEFRLEVIEKLEFKSRPNQHQNMTEGCEELKLNVSYSGPMMITNVTLTRNGKLVKTNFSLKHDEAIGNIVMTINVTNETGYIMVIENTHSSASLQFNIHFNNKTNNDPHVTVTCPALINNDDENNNDGNNDDEINNDNSNGNSNNNNNNNNGNSNNNNNNNGNSKRISLVTMKTIASSRTTPDYSWFYGVPIVVIIGIYVVWLRRGSTRINNDPLGSPV